VAEFDQRAATWDDDPAKVNRAVSIADSLSNKIDLSTIKMALEYGSGTGLLCFALKDRLTEIVLMDESAAMIDVARAKCTEKNVKHLNPIQYDLLKRPLPDFKFDLIFILLTLHHISDTSAIINKFQQLLNRDGYLAIIDLVEEDGSFHQDEFHGHNGFDRQRLETLISAQGLRPLSYEVCYELERDTDEGVVKYPLFLLVSQKKS
jgi:ubiquinone/menaquinone biosynthesis C-methylase UbiE